MPRDVVVPEVGEAGMTVTFVGWLRAEGDLVRAGEPLFEVDTEKVRLDIEAYADGILTGLRVQPGDEIEPHQVIATIVEPGASAGDPPPGPTSSASRAVGSPGPEPAASPRARRLAEQLGVDLRDAVGTGPNGVITEPDVRAVADRAGALQPPTSTGAEG